MSPIVGYADGAGPVAGAIYIVTKLYLNGPLDRRIHDKSVTYDTGFVLGIARDISRPMDVALSSDDL